MKPTDIIGCGGSVVLLLLAFVWIPVLGLFLALLTPLPFLYYATKLGLRDAIKLAAITLLIVGLIANLAAVPEIMVSCLASALLGLILSESYRRRLTLGFTVFLGTCSLLLVTVLFFSLATPSGETGVMEMTPDHPQDIERAVLQAYKDLGLNEEQVIHLQVVIKDMIHMIPKIYPAILIVGSALNVCFIVLLSRPLLLFKGLPYPDFGPMDRWQSPELMVWGVIATGFALFLSTGGIRWFAINSLIVMAVIYVLHGLSIVRFYLNRYRTPLWLRFGVYLLIFIQPIFLGTLATAGLFDQWVDFRRINKKAGK
jgi:uncharacterized protein YybS (DUF2232 family)